MEQYIMHLRGLILQNKLESLTSQMRLGPLLLHLRAILAALSLQLACFWLQIVRKLQQLGISVPEFVIVAKDVGIDVQQEVD